MLASQIAHRACATVPELAEPAMCLHDGGNEFVVGFRRPLLARDDEPGFHATTPQCERLLDREQITVFGLGRAVEITERISHPQRLRARPVSLKPIWSDTAVDEVVGVLRKTAGQFLRQASMEVGWCYQRGWVRIEPAAKRDP